MASTASYTQLDTAQFTRCSRPPPSALPAGAENGYSSPVPHSFSADSDAPVDTVWALVARPSRWPEWAPHVRGAWGLGFPEIEAGRCGAARLLWIVPVPASISAKTPGRSWTWRVGPMTLDHLVEPRGTGSRITMTMSAPGPLDAVLGVTYGPVVRTLVRRLARVAGER